MKKAIKKILTNRYLAIALSFLMVVSIIGANTFASDSSQEVQKTPTINIEGDFTGTLNIYMNEDGEVETVQPEMEGDNFGANFVINKNNPIFPNGIRGGSTGLQIVNSSGQVVANINTTNATTSGYLDVGTYAIVGTNFTGEDGVMTYNDASASTTLLTDMLTLARTHSDATTGADDGIGSCMLFTAEDESTGATTTSRICSVLDDTSTTSKNTSIDFYGNDGSNTLWASLVDGDFFVDTNSLYVDASTNRVGIGTTTPAVTLDIAGAGGGTATTSIAMDNICLSGYDNTGTTLYYLTLDSLGSWATSTSSCR